MSSESTPVSVRHFSVYLCNQQGQLWLRQQSTDHTTVWSCSLVGTALTDEPVLYAAHRQLADYGVTTTDLHLVKEENQSSLIIGCLGQLTSNSLSKPELCWIDWTTIQQTLWRVDESINPQTKDELKELAQNIHFIEFYRRRCQLKELAPVYAG